MSKIGGFLKNVVDDVEELLGFSEQEAKTVVQEVVKVEVPVVEGVIAAAVPAIEKAAEAEVAVVATQAVTVAETAVVAAL